MVPINGEHCKGAEQNKVEPPLLEVLFWSRRGEIACQVHAPDRQSQNWTIDGWREIPAEADGRRGLKYQCPRCAPNGRMRRTMTKGKRLLVRRCDEPYERQQTG